jgi:hypothetical protein
MLVVNGIPLTCKILQKSKILKYLLALPDEGDVEIPFSPESIRELNDFLNDDLKIEDFTDYDEIYRLTDYLGVSGFEKFENLDTDRIKKLFQQEEDDFKLEEDLRKQYLENEKITQILIDPFRRRVAVAENKIDIMPGMILNFYEREYYEQDPEDLHPLGTIATSLNDFQSRFNERLMNQSGYTITDWNNIVVAGGFVLGALIPYPFEILGTNIDPYQKSDVDVFLYGLTEEQAKIKILEFIRSFRYQWVVRTARTISFKVDKIVISIILRLYQDPLEVILGFDLDCAKCYYNGREVRMLPSCYRSIVHRYNVVRGDFQLLRNGTFENRCKKYYLRGFRIRVPGYHPRKVDTNIFFDNEVKGLAKLLRLLADQNTMSQEEDRETYGYGNNFIVPEREYGELWDIFLHSPSFIILGSSPDLRNIFQSIRWAIDNDIDRPLRKNLPEFHFIGSMAEYLKGFNVDEDWFEDAYREEYL